MMAQIVDMVPHEFIHTSGDAHIYSNSFKATEELLKREPKDLPQVKIDENIEDIYKFRFEDFEIDGYDPHPNIPVKVAV